MRRFALVVPLMLVLATALWWGLRDPRPLPGGASRPGVAPAAPTPSVGLAIEDSERADVGSGGERAAVALLAAAEPPQEEPASGQELGGFRGRLLLQDGSPAAGASAWAYAWHPERGVPEGWERNVPGTVDENGVFEVRFLVDPEVEYTAAAWMAGCAQVSWDRKNAEPDGQVVELGEAVLVPAGDLRVRLVDRDGAAWPLEMGLHADPGGTPRWNGPQWRTPGGRYRPERGSVLFRGLPVGQRSVKGGSDGATVRGSGEVRAGEETEITLTVEVEDRSSDIRVRPDVGRFEPLESQSRRETIRLVSEADGQRFEGWYGTFEDMQPGTYRAEIEAPGFLPEQRSGLRPGDEVDVELRPSCSMVLEVVAADTGEPIQTYGVEALYPRSGTSAMTVELADAVEPRAGSGRFGLPAVPTELRVFDASAREAIVVLNDLQAGERRTVRAELAARPSLEVRVVGEPSGRPRAGVHIELRRVLDEQDARPRVLRMDLFGEGTTDANGRIAFHAVSRAALELLARPAGSPGPTYRVLEPGELGAEAIEIPVPDFGVVRGRVENLPPGEGALLALLPSELDAGGGAMPWQRVVQRGVRVPVEPDGAFGPIELQPGTYRVALPAQNYEEPWEERAWLSRQAWIAGAEQTVESGADHRWRIDAAASLPASLTAVVSIDGAPLAGAKLDLRPIEGQGAEASTILDGRGHCDALAVSPGRYQVTVQVEGDTLDTRLRALIEPDLAVLPGSDLGLERLLVTARRELELVLPDGVAPNAMIEIEHVVGSGSTWAPGFSFGSRAARTFWGVVGSYRIEIDGFASAEFELREGEGPLVVEFVAQED